MERVYRTHWDFVNQPIGWVTLAAHFGLVNNLLKPTWASLAENFGNYRKQMCREPILKLQKYAA